MGGVKIRKVITACCLFSLIIAVYPQTIFAVLYSYNLDSRLKSETYIKDGIQYQRNYTYDSNGNLLGKVSQSESFLLLQSSFETNTDSENFKSSSPLFSMTANNAKEGKQSLYFHSDHPTVVTSESISLEVTPNTTYTLSGWIYNALHSGNTYMDWMEYNASGLLIYDGGTVRAIDKNKWQYDRMEFTTKSQTSKIILRVVVDEGATGESFFDDIKFEKNNTLPLSKASFEPGETSWYSNVLGNSFSISANAAKDGRQGLQFHSDYPVTATAECSEFIVSPNTKYVLSGWLYNALRSGNTYIDWMEYNEDGQLVYDGGSVYSTEKSTWQYGNVEFITKSSTVKIILRVVVDGNAFGNVYVDGIQFDKGSDLPLVDSSFEEDDNLWYTPSAVFAKGRVESKEGLHSMQFQSSSPVTVTADYGKIVVNPNTKYVLSGWIYNAMLTGVISVDWLEFNEEGQVIYDGGTVFSSVKNQWGFSSVEFITKPQTVSIVLRIVADSNATGTAYIDCIKLVKDR